uniref:hypothetical protein n=1 Tax=Parerythrobacter lutipelagi TaxID=1964208 RepID=UPI0010F8DE63|nr:hypothetical protein [Parerythrobacter lutipelagi]
MGKISIVTTSAALLLSGCVSAGLPTRPATDIQLLATASGTLAEQGKCVFLQGPERIFLIWPTGSSRTPEGVRLPDGTSFQIGSEITLIGGFNAEYPAFRAAEEACGTDRAFAVNLNQGE